MTQLNCHDPVTGYAIVISPGQGLDCVMVKTACPAIIFRASPDRPVALFMPTGAFTTEHTKQVLDSLAQVYGEPLQFVANPDYSD